MMDRINVNELRKAIARTEGDVFSTKDVSEQRALQDAHRSDAGHRNWHAMVGRAISQNAGALGVKSVGRGSRGEKWGKLTSVSVSLDPASTRSFVPHATRRRPPTSVPSPPNGIGPQHSGDTAFTARMRLHQSWWRSQVLELPFGVGPQASSSNRYGNYFEPADALAGKNFLAADIYDVVKRRLSDNRGTIDRFRLLHNLLTSQAMCFNLFGPLVDDLDRATRFLRALLGVEEVARVTRVEIEWAPEPASAYLDDRTAFDAVLEYERSNGELVLVGIETKLTDPFSQKPYDGERYRQWMRSSRSPFRLEAHAQLSSSRFCQVWRNHLLAIAIRDRAGSRYSAVRSIVVHHPLDQSAIAVLGEYRHLLNAADETFTSWPVDAVVAAFEGVASENEATWLRDFRRRYLALDESEYLLSS